MAAPIYSHGETFRHEMGGSCALHSRFLRALNLFQEQVSSNSPKGGDRTPGAAHSSAAPQKGEPIFRHESGSVSRQEMLVMDGIDLPDFESLDALPSTMVSDEENAGPGDEFSDDPDQLWFDETVTTMFMEDADKPTIETAPVEPRMETKAWPPGLIAKGIDLAFTGFVENDETEDLEAAAQPEAEHEAQAPTPDTFLVTAKDEVAVDSETGVSPVPLKPRPIDDVPAPGQELPFAAMLDSGPASESGKRGMGVKLAPGWKPLRGQKLNPPSKAGAADTDTEADADAATGAERELVQATLRPPRQDSILDGFGQFLEEQVILSAAIDEPDFKALAPLFEGGEAESNSPETGWQATSTPTSSSTQPEAKAEIERPSSFVAGSVLPDSPSDAAPRVKTEWISGAPSAGGEAEVTSAAACPAETSDDERQSGLDRDSIAAADPAESPAAKLHFPFGDTDETDPAGKLPVDELDDPKFASASDALPKSSQPISAPPLVAGDQPRGFSASLLYGAEPAGSFFDDLGDDSAATHGEVVENDETSQPVAVEVASESGGKSLFPKAIDTADSEAQSEAEPEPEPAVAEPALPWQKAGSEAEQGAVAEVFGQAVPPTDSAGLHAAEVPAAEDDGPTVTAVNEPVMPPPPADDIPVSALGYSQSRTNPALIKHGVTCPSCGVNLQIQARYLNIEGKCPGCSEMIVARQRGMVEPVAELATGRFPSFDHQPDLEPSDVPGGTVLTKGAADEAMASEQAAQPAQAEPPAIPSTDPFSNPNHALKKVREAAAGGVWGPTSGEGLS